MTTWLNIGAVGVAGALGAISRYLITLAAVAFPGGTSLWGTTLSNVIGCAALGALMEYSLVEGAISTRLALAIRVGFLGSLTTFSTFTAESAALADSGRTLGSGLYVILNLAAGWLALTVAAGLVKGWLT